MCMRVRRSMFFGVSYLVLWDNVQNKPDQSTLGRDERRREKMGFITHSGDQSLSLQGKKKPHSVQFHTEIPTITQTKSSAHMHNTMQLHKMGKLSSSSQRSRLRELGQE